MVDEDGGRLLMGEVNPIGAVQLDALSWALAARLARRHPDLIRIFHGRPGGGQSDVLWLRDDELSDRGGDVRLNRVGSIQVHRRFDGDLLPDGKPVVFGWDQVLPGAPLASAASDFTSRLERAAGLRPAATTPAATRSTLTWRTIAALLSLAATTDRPLTAEPGYYDNDYSSVSPHFAAFPAIPASASTPRPEDPYNQSGYRFWFVIQGSDPVLALEQTSAVAWVAGSEAKGLNLAREYQRLGRDLTALLGSLGAAAHLSLH